MTDELLRLSHLPPRQLVDYPADLVARLRRMREAHGYSRIRMLVHIERCERARGLVAYPTSMAAVAAHNAPERVAIRMLDSELAALPSFVESCGYERLVAAATRHESAFAKPQG